MDTQEFPFQGLEEIIPKKELHPGVLKLKKVFRYLGKRTNGIKYKVEDYGIIKVKIESRKVEIRPYEVRIKLGGGELTIHWHKKDDDEYIISITVIDVYEDCLFKIEKYTEILLRGYFEMKMHKNSVIIELEPYGKAIVSYHEE